jgi:hypothetical protein
MDGPTSPTPEAEPEPTPEPTPEHHAGTLMLSGEGNPPAEPEADR